METVERLEIQRKARIFQNIQASRIPSHTQEDRRLNKINVGTGNGTAVEAINDLIYGEMMPPLLLLIGVRGVGKTTLAYATAWEYLEDGFTVWYWQVEELLNELQSNLEDGKEYGRIWTKLRTVDLLILDDIGAHNPTKWRNAQLDALVDFRYREEAPLLLTANKADFDETGRIIDRIREGRTVMIKGHSMRGKVKGK